jgi:hypothetical protein
VGQHPDFQGIDKSIICRQYRNLHLKAGIDKSFVRLTELAVRQRRGSRAGRQGTSLTGRRPMNKPEFRAIDHGTAPDD